MPVRTLCRGSQTQRLAVADLTIDGVQVLAGMGPAEVVYSDPPWNPGNEKWWRRHAKEAPPASYDVFLDRWCAAVVALKPRHVLVEQSAIEKHWRLLVAATERCPGWRWPLVRVYGVRYERGKRPNTLLHFGPTPLASDPTGMHGEEMTRTALRGLALPARGVLADPCTGLGTTSRLADEIGWDFIGTELNPARLERTAGWLLKHGYQETKATPDVSPASQILAARELPVAARVALYNETQRALAQLVADVCPDPAAAPQLLPVERIHANDYNPNKVASPELALLEDSMRADGITMSVVVAPERGEWTVIDGFHRRTVGAERLGRAYLPCSVIDRPMGDRMASTVRHNRARGKHQVDLMAALVKGMIGLGWTDEQMAKHLGMSVEELLRLRQMVGVARLLAGDTYSRSWGKIEEPAVEAEA